MAIDTKGNVFAGDLTNLGEKEMLEQAKIFSEGSPALEELLVLLWGNGIQTIGSCSGHEGEGYPYISFYIDKLSDGQTRKLLTELCSNMKELVLVSVNKNRNVEDPIYDEQGNIIGKQKAKRPLNINMGFEKDKGFDVNLALEVVKDVFSREKPVEYYEEKFAQLPPKDQEFIEDIVKLKHMENQKLDFSSTGNSLEKLNCDDIDFDIRKSNVGISYENNFQNVLGNTIGIEHSCEFDSVKRVINGDKIEYIPIKRNAVVWLKVGSNAYTELKDGEVLSITPWMPWKPELPDTKFIIDKETGEVVTITDEEIKERGLLSTEEYWQKFKELNYGKENFDKILDMAKEEELRRNQQYEFIND